MAVYAVSVPFRVRFGIGCLNFYRFSWRNKKSFWSRYDKFKATFLGKTHKNVAFFFTYGLTKLFVALILKKASFRFRGSACQ